MEKFIGKVMRIIAFDFDRALQGPGGGVIGSPERDSVALTWEPAYVHELLRQKVSHRPPLLAKEYAEYAKWFTWQLTERKRDPNSDAFKARADEILYG